MNDAARCKALLNLHETGFAISSVMRANLLKYIPLLVFLAGGIWLLNGHYHEHGLLLIGFIGGAILRDIGWIYRIRKGWPLTVRITDWEIVQNIADGKSATE